MDGKTIGIIAVVIIVLIGGWIWLSGSPTPAPAPSGPGVPDTTTDTNPVVNPVGTNPVAVPAQPVNPGTTSTTTTTTTTTRTTTGGVTIAYTNQGFSPKTISVPVGTQVTFVNQTSENMWVASAPHPTHQGYDGTTESVHCASGYSGPAPLDQCAFGTSFAFTFGKVGTWPYHNHASPTDFGMVTVTAAQ
jgi:plastocyanin